MPPYRRQENSPVPAASSSKAAIAAAPLANKQPVHDINIGLDIALRAVFGAIEAAPVPAALLELLDRLGSDDTAPEQPRPAGLSDAEFKKALAAVIPQLRAFGRSLSHNHDTADDLVQETMLKAWAARDSFIAGTNLRAWTNIILRNVYFSQVRRAKFKGEWDEFAADLQLAVAPSQESNIALKDLQRAMAHLPIDQREAVILMGAGGMTCEEVAEICRCPVGTVKSRVSRGRATLKTLLEGGQLDAKRSAETVSTVSPFDQIMQQARVLAAPKPRSTAIRR
jgi:RNA polymerase sigma-70 factor, ECF subfamily